MNPSSKAKMAKVFLLCSLFVLTGLSSVVRAQDFPPPMYSVLNVDGTNLVYQWGPPENATPVGYKVYRTTANSQIQLGFTSDTSFTMPLPDFSYFLELGLTAVYSNPDGESSMISINMICPLVWSLPVNVDFEQPGIPRVGLACEILNGSDLWEIQDTVFHSTNHAAAYYSLVAGSSASLYSTHISIDPNIETQLDFWLNIPNSNGFTDSLTVFYMSTTGWQQVGETIHSTDNWQLFTFNIGTDISGSKSLKFVATSGAGGGVYLDDIVFKEKTISVENPPLNAERLNLYPNPASHRTTVTCCDMEFGYADVNIYNGGGTLVKSVSRVVKTSLFSGFDLDLRGLSAGIYFVEIAGEKGRLTQTLVIRP